MAAAILAAVVVLVVIGIVAAAWAAARSRRQFPLAFKPAPWSEVELDELRSADVNDLGGPEPFDMLARADLAANSCRQEPTLVADAARRAEMAPIAALEPDADVKGQVPVVVLVAGAGYLGTGTTAALLERGKPGTAADLPRSRQDGERRLRLA